MSLPAAHRFLITAFIVVCLLFVLATLRRAAAAGGIEPILEGVCGLFCAAGAAVYLRRYNRRQSLHDRSPDDRLGGEG